MSAQAAQGQPLLAVRDVSVVFGGIVALNSVSFNMRQGNILGLIGPNGAGKTTLFNCLSRLYQPSKGDILVEGQTILNRPAHKICDVGIGRTFQNVALFPNMSVNDNIRVGAHWHTKGNIISDALHLPCDAQAGARDEPNALPRSSIISICRRCRTCWFPDCRSARRSASNSRARLRPSRGSCCWTSRPAD